MAIYVVVHVDSAIKDAFTYPVRKSANVNFFVVIFVLQLLAVPTVVLPVLETVSSHVLMVLVVQNATKIVSSAVSRACGSVNMSNALCLVESLAIGHDVTDHVLRS